jgi:hypothetical protein
MSSSTSISVYRPNVKVNPIYHKHPANKPLLRYTHDVDIVKFKGRFFAAWNANSGTVIESSPGQFNYLSVSDDFENWTTPVRIFCAEGGCENPVETDNQWQPIFVNYKDEILYCAWCDFTERKTYVASSIDGLKWRNQEVPVAPDVLAGKVIGVPTNHGVVTKDGVLLVPCSLAHVEDKMTPRNTRYAAVLRSEDGGASWHWGDLCEAAEWNQFGEDASYFGGDFIALWEPSVYELADGRLGMLIRNSTAQDAVPPRPEKPHRMLWHADSDDGGLTWSKARPVEVDTICARNYAVASAEASNGLLMVMNDHWVGIPRPICHDRYSLSLFCSPNGDPDLLLPGPLVQSPGGRAYYPNGFIDGNRLYVGYSCLNGMYSSIIDPLPDFSEPFLLPRDSRPGLLLDGNTASFSYPENTLGLVLTEKLSEQPELNLCFSFRIQRYNGESFPLLALGGKTVKGALLRTVFSEEKKHDILQAKTTSGDWIYLADITIGSIYQVRIALQENDTTVCVDDRPSVSLGAGVMRKIAFGGLYEPPEWPLGMRCPAKVEVFLNSIEIF